MVANRGFICRAAHTKAGDVAPNVTKVAAGDRIHFYFTQPGKKARDIGSYEVISPEEHPKPEVFGEPVAESALHSIEDAEFADFLAGFRGKDGKPGYEQDTMVDKYVGWPVRKVGAPPPFDPKWFSGMISLRPLPTPTAE